MNILVIGASGRLGRRLIPALVEAGHDVSTPPRSVCDAADPDSVLAAIRRGAIFDLVVCLAAYADVVGCDANPTLARVGNVGVANAVGKACAEWSVPWLWTSSDYVVAGGPTPAEPKQDALAFGRLRMNNAGRYAEMKLEAEDAALGLGATVARIAFCDPDDAAKWAWVDGYNLASREWVERTAARLALAAPLAAEGWNSGSVVHVGPVAGLDDGPLGPWRTREQLVRRRFGNAHPSLCRVVRSPTERRFLGGGNGPGDTRFARCDPHLALDDE
jgi:hypothetical protein